MEKSDKDNADLLKSVAIHGNQIYDRTHLPPGVLLNDPIVADIHLKFDTYFDYWMPKMKKVFIRTVGVQRCTDSLSPSSPLYLERYDAHYREKTAEELYSELMRKLTEENLTALFLKKVIEPAIAEMRNIVYVQPSGLVSAMMDKYRYSGNAIAYARFSIAGQSQQETVKKWGTYDYKEYLVQSGGEYFADNYIKGEQRTGKSTLGLNIMKLGIEMGDWTYSNYPVVNNDEIHIYHVRKLSDLFSRKNGIPSVWDFGSWLETRKKMNPEFSSTLNLVTDEMGKNTSDANRTTTSEGRFGSILQQYGRKVYMARTQIGVSKADTEQENKMTCVMTTYKEGSRFYVKVQRYEGEDKIEEKVQTEPADDLPFELFDVHYDGILPFEYDFNFVDMMRSIEDEAGKEVHELTYEELGNLSESWINRFVDLDDSLRKQKIIGVMVCPDCLERKPYNSANMKVQRCSNKECGTDFIVDPVQGLNFREMTPEDFQTNKNKKESRLGISICPYCGENDAYQQAKETIKMCSKYKKAYTVNPKEGKNWKRIAEGYEEEQKLNLKKENIKTESPERDARVIELYQAGQSERKIAAKMKDEGYKISNTMVHGVITAHRRAIDNQRMSESANAQ